MGNVEVTTCSRMKLEGVFIIFNVFPKLEQVALRLCNENPSVRLVALFLKIVLNNGSLCYDASYKTMVGKLM